MTEEWEKIINQAISEVNRKYEHMAIEEAKERGRKEGLKEGFKEAKEEIAKKLIGILKPEEISKVTGLSLKTILLLQNQ